jgi:hypothetical protein
MCTMNIVFRNSMNINVEYVWFSLIYFCRLVVCNVRVRCPGYLQEYEWSIIWNQSGWICSGVGKEAQKDNSKLLWITHIHEGQYSIVMFGQCQWSTVVSVWIFMLMNVWDSCANSILWCSVLQYGTQCNWRHLTCSHTCKKEN